MTHATAMTARRWWKRGVLLALIPLLAATALLSTSEPALAVPTATLTVSANGVTEGTDVVFTVNFNHSVAGDTFVMLTWSHGQTNASDFGQDSGRYTNCIFSNCQQPSPYALLVRQHTTSASWTIPILKDNVDEGPEQFTVALHSTQLQVWGTVVIASGQPSSQTVTIYEQFPATPNDDGSFTVAADWPLVPSGLSSGDRFRLIFATSKSTGVNATRIDLYNSYVDELAKAAALADYCCTITFKALASTATVDARDNLDLWDSAANQWSDTSSNVPHLLDRDQLSGCIELLGAVQQRRLVERSTSAERRRYDPDHAVQAESDCDRDQSRRASNLDRCDQVLGGRRWQPVDRSRPARVDRRRNDADLWIMARRRRLAPPVDALLLLRRLSGPRRRVAPQAPAESRPPAPRRRSR